MRNAVTKTLAIVEDNRDRQQAICSAKMAALSRGRGGIQRDLR